MTRILLATILAASLYGAWQIGRLYTHPRVVAPVSEGVPQGQVRGICAPGVRTGAVTCNSDALPAVMYGDER